MPVFCSHVNLNSACVDDTKLVFQGRWFLNVGRLWRHGCLLFPRAFESSHLPHVQEMTEKQVSKKER